LTTRGAAAGVASAAVLLAAGELELEGFVELGADASSEAESSSAA
jgi:hypothetical protein